MKKENENLVQEKIKIELDSDSITIKIFKLRNGKFRYNRSLSFKRELYPKIMKGLAGIAKPTLLMEVVNRGWDPGNLAFPTLKEEWLYSWKSEEINPETN